MVENTEILNAITETELLVKETGLPELQKEVIIDKLREFKAWFYESYVDQRWDEDYEDDKDKREAEKAEQVNNPSEGHV